MSVVITGGVGCLLRGHVIMRLRSDYSALARRYLNCARQSVKHADMSINNKERAYHIAVGDGYLLLAERALRVARKHAVRGPPFS
jgi:hypothetical protein